MLTAPLALRSRHALGRQSPSHHLAVLAFVVRAPSLSTHRSSDVAGEPPEPRPIRDGLRWRGSAGIGDRPPGHATSPRTARGRDGQRPRESGAPRAVRESKTRWTAFGNLPHVHHESPPRDNGTRPTTPVARPPSLARGRIGPRPATGDSRPRASIRQLPGTAERCHARRGHARHEIETDTTIGDSRSASAWVISHPVAYRHISGTCQPTLSN
jgi:hypothetical protein